VCTRLLEPAGLQSGITTVDDFLLSFGDVFPDFMERTGVAKIIITGAIHFGISAYQVPDQISHVDAVFVSGRLLRRTNMQDLDNGTYQWRKRTGIPSAFHEDGLPVKQIELYPQPVYEGQAIPTEGPGVIFPPETDEYMIVGDFYPPWRDYTLVGSQVPLNPDLTVKTSWLLTDSIDGIPRSAVPYLAFGVGAEIFSDDSEAKDAARAKYCETRYEEGVAVFRQIVAERFSSDPDNAM